MPNQRRRRAILTRCCWEDGRGRCRANGEGEPPLCRKHYEWLYHGTPVDDGPVRPGVGSARDELLDTIVNHPGLNKFGRRVDQRVQGLFDQLADGLERAAQRAFDRPVHTRPEYQGSGRAFHAEWPPRPAGNPGPQQPPPRQPPPRQPPPPQSSAGIDPHTVLGFAPNARLTPEIVKKRRRELARIFHSDQGGNEEAMRRVNMAVDLLLSQLR